MSGVDAYVANLRAALGDRLPPSVTTARLREARSHLLASAEDIGEAEAIRRYGRARAVASALVRAQRGYAERSAWSLALPLAAAFLVAGALSIFLRVFPAFRVVELGPRLSLLFVFAFALRAAQTRRWIAGPMAAAHLTGALFVMALNHVARSVDGWSVGEALPYVVVGAVFGTAWCAVNALALGAGALLDLRRVRPAGGAR